ncbi:MAG: VanZ family protein [Oscillospiraceae bacterium]
MNHQKKRTTAELVLALLTLLWCTIIFLFSAATGTESEGVSGDAAQTTLETVFDDFHQYPQPQRESMIAQLDHILRKCSHFLEYMVLGVLAALTLRRQKGLFRFAAATAFCFVYAASDEFHQHFSNGRSPSVTDVGIDTGGALTGICAVVLVSALVKLARKPKVGKSEAF